MDEIEARGGNVLLVEDEAGVREAAKVTLELAGYSVIAVDSAIPALEVLNGDWVGVVVSDVKMPGMNGLELLMNVKAIRPRIPVILVTAHGDVSMALTAVRGGAYDFIEKPVTPELLLDVVRRAAYAQDLEAQNEALRSQLAQRDALEGRVIGSSEAMVRLRDLITDLADADVDVLIHGETGTGKELVARALHDFSPRKDGAFVALNCGALPETVVESELFGHMPGAFTDAKKVRIGKIEHASGGTLFLDEIESMPMPLQVKMLRVLQERVVERLGGNDPIPVDVKIIAATKADLLEQSKKNSFRDDLYYRLSIAHVEIPPLRQRLSDLPLLFSHFVSLAASRLNKKAPEIDAHHIASLATRPWEGNIRELRNVAERFVLGISRQLNLAPNVGPSGGDTDTEGTGALDLQLADFEHRLIRQTLAQNNGRISETAAQLGIPRKKLYLRMKRYDLHKSDFKSA